MPSAIIIFAVYSGVGTSLYRKAGLAYKCMRGRTLKRTDYFCSALDMFTIMIGVWVWPLAICAAGPRFIKARGVDLFPKGGEIPFMRVILDPKTHLVLFYSGLPII